jgi:hypothetical protein
LCEQQIDIWGRLPQDTESAARARDSLIDAREGDVKTQDRKMITRVVRGKAADRSFDIDFWQQQGDEAIFSAAWDMVLMAEEFRRGRQPTFQRTVTRVQRKRG